MLIPDNMKPEDFESDGELRLYRKFKYEKEVEGAYVLHSLFTNFHTKNPSGELDFLVLVPRQGFFAIEVKHGHVKREQGMWVYTNRKREKTKKPKSPFAQVSDSYHSIRYFLLKKAKNSNPGLYNRLSKIIWSTGVAFTSMEEFVDFEPEGESWQVLSKSGLSMPIINYLFALSKGEHDRSRHKGWYDPDLSRPTKKDCEDVIKVLRGDFDISYNALNDILDTNQSIEEFTEEQFSVLDFTRFNRKSLIQGGAGTGKTLLALEVFRKQIMNGNSVGLFCYNTRLGEKLHKISSKIEGDTVTSVCGTFHSYLIKKTGSVAPDDVELKNNFFKEDLPLQFLIEFEETSEEEKFDYLILDEAQDLISLNYLEIFNLILKGGLSGGKWAMFGDFSDQSIYENDPERSLEILKDYSEFSQLPPLKVNCRNLPKVSQLNSHFTGVTYSRIFFSDNQGFRKVYYPVKNKRIDIIIEILNSLKKGGIGFEEITLLSPKTKEKCLIHLNETIENYLQQGVEFSTIQSFKGLENSIIILFDFDEIASEQSRRLLYVGISRAKQRVHLILDKSLMDSAEKIMMSNQIS